MNLMLNNWLIKKRVRRQIYILIPSSRGTNMIEAT